MTAEVHTLNRRPGFDLEMTAVLCRCAQFRFGLLGFVPVSTDGIEAEVDRWARCGQPKLSLDLRATLGGSVDCWDHC
jgi:hypothetical protein